MTNKKGFTLMELLAVIVILMILTVIAVPSITSLKNKTNEKLYENKTKIAEKALLLWAQDNPKCFTDPSNAYNCLTIVNNEVTYGEMALKGLIKYDNDQNEIINPINGEVMNNYKIEITYNIVSNSFKVGQTHKD